MDMHVLASQVAQMVKNLSAMWETQVRSLGQEIPWRRAWQPIPAFLPGEFHRERSLAGYSPWGHRVGHNWVMLLYLKWIINKDLTWGILLSVMWQPGWEGSLGDNGYMYMYDCSLETITTLLVSYNPIQNKRLKKKKSLPLGCYQDGIKTQPWQVDRIL